MEYVTRGNYRMPVGGGPLEANFDNSGQTTLAPGTWMPLAASSAFYDVRQDGNTQDTNERRRFNEAFFNAPENVPVDQLDSWMQGQGWQEPDRSGGSSFFEDILPIAGLALGGWGLGSLAGLWGGAGAAGVGAGLAEGFGGAGMLGDAAMWGLGDAAASAGALSSVSDFSNLGDLWNYGSSAADAGSGTFDLNKLLGITDTGQMSYIPGSSLESITGNPEWDAMFGQVAGQGASFPAGFSPSLWDTLKSSLTDPKNAGKLAQALSGFGTTPTMQGGGASMPSFPSSYGGGSSGSTGAAPMPQAQQPLATPQFESNFQPMNVVAPQFTGFQQNNPLSDPFAESHATWAGPQYAKALRG